VPFLLTIRHSSKASDDHFAEDEVVRFAAARVRVGQDEECEQTLPDAQLPAVAFTLVSAGHRVRLEPEPGVRLEVNGEAAPASRELLSGDQVCLGDWQLYLHKTYGDPNDRRRRKGLAAFARVLVALILLAELSIVVWLPRQVASAAHRGARLAKQRTFQLLDDLRTRVRKEKADKGGGQDKLVQAARDAVAEELEHRARYVRSYQSGLSAEQCHRMYEELQALGAVLDRLQTGRLLQPIPSVDADAAVKATLHRAGWSAPKP
jgi:hypothetical protein